MFQTRLWLNFVSETQNAGPVIVKITDHNQTIGFFTGLIIKKLGFKILGSPFPGWTTSYMGFNLVDGVERGEVLKEFIPFVFKELGCIHLEIMDRNLTEGDCDCLNLSYKRFSGYEVDLTSGKDQVFADPGQTPY